MRKCVITVVGKDTVGIIAKVCTYLAETKIMIVDTGASAKTYDEVITDLDKLGEEIGVAIKCQREEIFDMMHRI